MPLAWTAKTAAAAVDHRFIGSSNPDFCRKIASPGANTRFARLERFVIES